MKYIISAGGTGGHIYPAISIINKIKEEDKKAEFLYIGTTNRMEKDIIPALGIKYIGINIIGMSKNPVRLCKAGYYNIKDYFICKKIIKEFKPNIVIGVGGYVTVPVVLASSKLNIPILLHEQNALPGKANKFLSRYATVICTSVESSKEYFPQDKCVFTGNPRGEEVLKHKKANKTELGLDKNKKLVLITTGSLGSQSVNGKIKSFLLDFKSDIYEILFVTGKSSYDEFKDIKVKGVKIVSYLDNMPEVLQITDFIISRAGASTIAEITALGIPSILIPSPYVANNHQYLNALDLEKKHACILIEEKDLTKELLQEKLDFVLTNKKEYDKLKQGTKSIGVTDSATRVYKQIKKIIK